MENSKCLQNDEDFFQHAFKNKIPYSVNIELLTKCNLRCKHCYIPNHDNPGLSFDTIKNVFKQLKELGTLIIVLTGGEIFLHKDIKKIIELGRHMGFRMILFTNATLLDDTTICWLKEMNIHQISISLYSLDSEIHDGITKVEGSLHNLMKNIMSIKKNGLDLEIKAPLMQDNLRSYDDLVSFCEKNNFVFNANTNIFVKNDGDTTPHQYRITEDDLISQIQKIDNYSVEKDKYYKVTQKRTKDTLVCPSLSTGITITARGDVYPCFSFMYTLGNIYKDSIKHILENKDLKRFREMTYKELDECLNCKYLECCDRCPGLALLEEENIYGCSAAAKRDAVARYKYLNLNMEEIDYGKCNR